MGNRLKMIVLLITAAMFQLVEARMPATFKASMCYDVRGRAEVTLRCPPSYTIQTRTSFTGISRYSACSYMAWDCVVQEGATQRCDGQTTCTVGVTYTDSQQAGALSCGDGTQQTKYFQIEYECRSDDGSQAVVFEPSVSPSPRSSTQSTIGPTTGQPQNEPPDDTGKDKQYDRREMESKVTLVAIVCGSAIAMIFVVVVMATLAHRIKKRIYENSSVYGPLRGGGNVGPGPMERSPSGTSHLYSSYISPGTSQLSLDSPRTSVSHLHRDPCSWGGQDPSAWGVGGPSASSRLSLEASTSGAHGEDV